MLWALYIKKLGQPTVVSFVHRSLEEPRKMWITSYFPSLEKKQTLANLWRKTMIRSPEATLAHLLLLHAHISLLCHWSILFLLLVGSSEAPPSPFCLLKHQHNQALQFSCSFGNHNLAFSNAHFFCNLASIIVAKSKKIALSSYLACQNALWPHLQVIPPAQ